MITFSDRSSARKFGRSLLLLSLTSKGAVLLFELRNSSRRWDYIYDRLVQLHDSLVLERVTCEVPTYLDEFRHFIRDDIIRVSVQREYHKQALLVSGVPVSQAVSDENK